MGIKGHVSLTVKGDVLTKKKFEQGRNARIVKGTVKVDVLDKEKDILSQRKG